MRFTDVGIRALKPKEKRYTIWSDGNPGFGVRVTPKGKISWIYMYYRPEGYRMMTLGNYPAMTLAQARKAYGAAQEEVEQKLDPGGRKVEKTLADRSAMTIMQLTDEYMERWSKPRKRSWRNDQHIIKKDVLPKWGRKKAKDIKRRDVIKLLDDIVHRGALSQANHTQSLLSRLFNFAVERDILENSPCYRVKKPAPLSRKDRALSEAEIKAFWKGFEDEECTTGELVELVLKGILLTGQRPGEVRLMQLSELDENRDWWVLPGEKTKNKRQHRVPISPMMKDVIERAIEIRPHWASDSDFVFASTRKAGQPINRDAVSREMRRNLTVLGLKENPATPHDLRRTFTTEGGRIGILREYRKRVLNHVDNDVTSIYDLYEYDREKKLALDRWSDYIFQIVNGGDQSSVIPFIRK